MHRFTRLLLLASLLMGLSAASFAGVFVSVSIGPPPIPVYAQPICPGAGYMWTPGYWGWGDDGYYWVPGTWVMAPEVGLLWTPGYWGWSGGAYLWHGGYWGPHVGFYGGINYGFGYGGVGFVGGEWRGGHYFYNRSVTHVNVTNVTNVYNKTVVVNNNHTSFNGGTAGVHAEPSAQEKQYENEKHVEPTSVQTQHMTQAAHNPQLLAKNNGGKPAVAATSKPGEFSGKGVVGAKAAGGPVNHAALTANAKTAAVASPKTGTTTGAKTGATTGGTKTTGSTTAHNVPKPPNASSSTSTHASTTGSTGSHPSSTTAHNVPKPPNAGSSTSHTSSSNSGTPHGSSTYSSQPHTSGGFSQPHNSGGSQPHSSAQPHSAPAPHNNPSAHSEKPKR